MTLNPDHCYEALISHDRRFDGRFYVAVRTTHIYCRPVCPVPPPKRQNVQFYVCAAAAEAAGFRPCRRCRPELAPGTAAGFDTSVTVTRALRLIASGVLDEDGLPGLSARLKVGERQLRRLFDKEMAASPIAIALTRRVHLARQLLTETTLPVTEIAYSAGFRSLRRFNDAFVRCFLQSPTQVRRHTSPAARGAEGLSLRLQLPFRSPYAWSDMLRFLAARAIPGVESTDSLAYRRTIHIGGHIGRVAVTRTGDDGFLTVTLWPPNPTLIMPSLDRLRQLFDCDASPLHLVNHFASDACLGPLVAANPGLRLPGAWDGFELAVRAVLGQQVSVPAASTLAGRLVCLVGVPLAEPVGDLTHLFPVPGALMASDLAAVGIPTRRAQTLGRLASAVHRGELVLDGSADPELTVQQLLSISGIGDWTAQYIAMRALRLPDAFPAGDLGLRRAWENRAGASQQTLASAAETWRPWRGYAAMHLWSSLA